MSRRALGIMSAVILGLWLLSVQDAGAGAWVQPRGKLFMSLQTYFYQTNHFYTKDGHLKDRGGDFRKWEFNAYLEYGLTDQDTLVCNLFYDWLSDNASGTEKKNQGFADVEISWRRLMLKRDPHVFSLQGTLIVPTGYDIEDDPRLGYGRMGVQGDLLYGRYFKLGDRYGFFDSGLGYRYYFGYPGSQIRSLVTLGYYLLEPLQLMGSAELHYGLYDGDNKVIGPNVILEPDYRLLKLSLAARWRFSPRYSLVAALYSHAWGENTGGDGGFYFSVWLNL